MGVWRCMGERGEEGGIGWWKGEGALESDGSQHWAAIVFPSICVCVGSSMHVGVHPVHAAPPGSALAGKVAAAGGEGVD